MPENTSTALPAKDEDQLKRFSYGNLETGLVIHLDLTNNNYSEAVSKQNVSVVN